jgi:GT2 family glycosyltransferase
MSVAPSVASVIVPVRNGRSWLSQFLLSLERQTVPRSCFEVIVADDGSTDGTCEWLAEHDARVVVVSGPPRNAYAARNMAAEHARSDVLAFCDVDCIPEPDWLDQGLRALAGADLVGGMIRFRVPDRRTAWTLLDIDLHVDQERAVVNGTALTGNLFVRRDLFDEAGGFDDSLPSHGDYEFVARCVERGARLGYSPAAMVSHPTHDRATPFLKKVWAAHWSRAVRELRRGQPSPILQKAFIPVFGMAHSRRRVGRSLRLDRRRLAANGVRAHVWDDVRALPILYFVLPYVAGAARLHARRTSEAGR